MRKPAEPSERCGVITAEKIVGSEIGALFAVMAVTIGETWRAKPFTETVRQSLKAAGRGNAAQVKDAKARAKADTEAADAEVPQ